MSWFGSRFDLIHVAYSRKDFPRSLAPGAMQPIFTALLEACSQVYYSNNEQYGNNVIIECACVSSMSQKNNESIRGYGIRLQLRISAE